MSSRFDRDPSIDNMLENDIRESFDKITPNEYMKQSILSDIEERDERSSGRKTAMQRLFAVRKVCVACIIVIVMIALSGGTYSAVSMINGGKEEKKSEEIDNKNDEEENEEVTDGDNYRDRLVNFLYGKETSEYQYTLEDWSINNYYQVTDYRMAEAFENIDTEYEKIECQDAEYTYIGMIAGEDISDMVFDKSEYHVFAAFVRENKEPVDWDSVANGNSDGFLPDQRTFITRKVQNDGKADEWNEQLPFNKYSMDCVRDSSNYTIISYMSGNYEYDVIDVTSFLQYEDKKAIYCIIKNEYLEYEEQYKCGTMDTYVDNSFVIDLTDISKKAPDYSSLLKNSNVYREKTMELYNDNIEKEWEKLAKKDEKKTLRFMKKYPEKILSDKGIRCEGELTDDFPYSIYNNFNYKTRRKFFSLPVKIRPDDQSEIQNDDIESVTLVTNNMTIFKKQDMTREDEKTVSDTGSILGSVMKYSEVNDKNKPFEVYIDCGNRVTIPYNQINVAGLYEYGMCIEEESHPDLNNCKTYSELIYAYDYWYADIMNNNDTRILVTYKDGYEEEFRLRLGFARSEVWGGSPYNLSGWEQIR